MSEGSKKGYLVLANGRVFDGTFFGASSASSGSALLGEVVFTTGMTGYLETLSDPSYHGQIVVQTFPLIGNYGVIPEDFESAGLHPAAYVVGEWCEHPSNFRSQGNLDGLMRERGLVGLSGVDTRTLTRIIREAGVMNAALTATPDLVDVKALAKHRAAPPVPAVSTREIVTCAPPPEKMKGEECCRVVLWDFGAKENIVRALRMRGVEVVRVPCSFTAKEILALEPDGLMLSNGPGDPAENAAIIKEIAQLLERIEGIEAGEAVLGGKRAKRGAKTTKAVKSDKVKKIPVFGICLGHQLLALATGARTEKLKYGHRGGNQPVRDLRTGRVLITTQNHGYAVLPESVDTDMAEVRFVNANDGTCEGIQYGMGGRYDALGVQFHPEAATGPQDTGFLFDRFMDCIRAAGGKEAN